MLIYPTILKLGRNDSGPKRPTYQGRNPKRPTPKIGRTYSGRNDPAETTQGRNDPEPLKQEPPVCRGWRLVCWKRRT